MILPRRRFFEEAGKIRASSPRRLKATDAFQAAAKTVYLSFEDVFPVAAFVSTSVSDWNEDLTGGTGGLEQHRYDLTLLENPLDPEQGTPYGDPIPYAFGLMTP